MKKSKIKEDHPLGSEREVQISVAVDESGLKLNKKCLSLY